MSQRNGPGYHFNGNLVCAIDCETTGLIPGYHDLAQICILPLTAEWRPSKEYKMFHMRIKPKRPYSFSEESAKITKKALAEVQQFGVDPYDACELFENWFAKLGLPERKSIVPLGMNYLSFDQHFIMDWLGGIRNYRSFFRSDARDIMIAALHHNDLAEYRSDEVPFAKVNLRWLANKLEVPIEQHHDAVGDCIVTAEIYRRLIRRAFNTPMVEFKGNSNPLETES